MLKTACRSLSAFRARHSPAFIGGVFVYRLKGKYASMNYRLGGLSVLRHLFRITTWLLRRATRSPSIRWTTVEVRLGRFRLTREMTEYWRPPTP